MILGAKQLFVRLMKGFFPFFFFSIFCFNHSPCTNLDHLWLRTKTTETNEKDKSMTGKNAYQRKRTPAS